MAVINAEALQERARALSTVPREIPRDRVDAIAEPCNSFLQSLYTLSGEEYVLNQPISSLSAEQKFRILECLEVLNGIRLVLVVSLQANQAILDVYFYNKNSLEQIRTDGADARQKLPIFGGYRVLAGDMVGQVQVTAIAADPDPEKPVLRLTVQPIGDYSTYTLSINTQRFPRFDPLFSEIPFKFRPGCFSTDCAPEWKPAPAPKANPAIDYLAKDFDSFKHTMIAAMMQRVPGWRPTSEADLDQVILELFSVAADELSDYQDRVMNEGYFPTARKRVSLARHGRLMDYFIHEGNQASTWLALEVNREDTLPADFSVWSGTAPTATDTVIFITRQPQSAHPLLNRMGLYTWSNAIPSLAAGSTTADLTLLAPDGVTVLTDQTSAETVQDELRSGRVPFLVIQEWLNPLTGQQPGRDPTRRQLLKLIPGVAAAEARQDPLTGHWFVRVRWEQRDALKRNYCFTVDCEGGRQDNVSLFHGNLVQIYHGMRRAIAFFKPGTLLTDETQFHYQLTERWGTICRLPDEPLAYENTPPGGEVPPKSTLEITVETPSGSDAWDERPSLIHSDNSSEAGDHFVVETDEAGRSLIRVGNGVNGRQLPDNAIVHCTYQVGRGLDGNVGADTLTQFDSSVAGGLVKTVWNPFDVTNGRAPEPVLEIIRRVPEAYRFRQLRAVTLLDYINRAEELPEVSRAVARYAWTGSWRTVQMAIDPVGTNTLDDATRRKIASHLDAVRLIGEDLEIRPPRFVPLDIRVVLCIHPDYWAEDIRFLLEQEFSEGYTRDGRMAFFHPDRWTFGQELHASQIIGRVQAIQGVDHVISVMLKRWNDPTPGTDVVVPVRVNEILRVRNDPDRLEDGFIAFDIRGGRQ